MLSKYLHKLKYRQYEDQFARAAGGQARREGYTGSTMAPMAVLPRKGTAPKQVKAVDCMTPNKISVINVGSMQDADRMQTAREDLAARKRSGGASKLDALSIKMVGNGVGVLVDANADAREEAARARARAEADKHRRCNMGDVCGNNYT